MKATLLRCRFSLFLVMVVCVFVFLLCSTASTIRAAAGCDEWVARIVSVEGTVQVQRVGMRKWEPVKLNETLCVDDVLRVHERSRAAILLRNETVLRLDQNTTITFSSAQEDTFLLKLFNGSAHFFSRSPRGLKVNTPFVNAAIGGTEFFIRVERDQTFVSTFEGKVTVANEAGSVTLVDGQSALTRAGQAPVMRIVVNPRDAVQWALYYPPILDYRPMDFTDEGAAGWQRLMRESLEFYWTRDLPRALSILDAIPADLPDPRFYTYRAALLLSFGRVDEAAIDIERALKLDPLDGRAVALESVIAVTQNKKERALQLARKSTELSPESSSTFIALSYAQQAVFDLDAALKSVQRAVEIAPDNALAWARLAELWLSLGYLDKAMKAAEEAVALNPNVARTQTVLGFAHLTRIEIREAREAFEKAIVLDQADPLPRLGLGLAKIRESDLQGGRREIEIAVILDPNNALLRSYLGKAYYEEKRERLAQEQYNIAKQLDPLDPTPWFYDAILKQTTNRAIEGLRDLQRSIELNENRAVYRSRLQLDEDLAARSASLARIYDEIGFEQLALVEAWKSLHEDPSNFSAHRFLADSYASQSRHEIARVSELLQSQLLQPININPVQPQLAESELFLLNIAGPSEASLNEYNPLFNRNRLALLISGLAGEHNTLSDEIVQNGIWGRFSYSIGQFHFESDGFRENNDQTRNIYNVFAQMSLSHKTSVQAEYRNRSFEAGDLLVLFDPAIFLDQLRENEDTESIRFGLRHAFTPRSDFIGSVSYQQNDFALSFDDFTREAEESGYSVEGQYIFHSERINVITGLGHFGRDREDRTILPSIRPSITETTTDHTNVYLYSFFNFPEQVTWILGGSGDFFDGGPFGLDRQQFNPKFGVLWNPVPETTLRAAAFRTFRRTLLSNQTLEPTQVAGFNQFFDDTEAADVWRYGVGVDQKLTDKLYAGAEFSKRDLTVTGIGQTGILEADWDELLGRAYLYWTPHRWLAFSTEYAYERYRRPEEFSGQEDITELDTHGISLGVSFFHPSGFFGRVIPSYVVQDGVFGLQQLETFISDEDRFWVLDAAIGYRLPKRYGLLTLQVQNLLDEEFKFQDTDPLAPSLFPKRLVLFKFTLSF